MSGMEEVLEKIEAIKDTVENLCFSINLTVPADIHVEGMRYELPQMLEKLNDVIDTISKM